MRFRRNSWRNPSCYSFQDREFRVEILIEGYGKIEETEEVSLVRLHASIGGGRLLEVAEEQRRRRRERTGLSVSRVRKGAAVDWAIYNLIRRLRLREKKKRKGK